MKLVVPSIGSITQTNSAFSGPDLPDSSQIKELSGKESLMVEIIIFSAISST